MELGTWLGKEGNRMDIKRYDMQAEEDMCLDSDVKNLEEENNKLRKALQDIKEKLSPPRRDYTGACFYIAEEALKGGN